MVRNQYKELWRRVRAQHVDVARSPSGPIHTGTVTVLWKIFVEYKVCNTEPKET